MAFRMPANELAIAEDLRFQLFIHDRNTRRVGRITLR